MYVTKPRLFLTTRCKTTSTTPMTSKDQVRSDWYEVWMTFSPMGRVGEPQEIAPAVVFFASDASSFFSGSNLVIDGGNSAGSPVQSPGCIPTFVRDLIPNLPAYADFILPTND
jgi:enoyl-ACP reductase-like protein